MATVSWLNGVDGDFADGANWSGGAEPAPGDDAQIEASGTYTVTSSADARMRFISVGDGAALDIAGGTFVLAGNANAEIGFGIDAGGSITVAGGADLRVQAASGATVGISGALDIDAGGRLAFAGPESTSGGEFSGDGEVTLGGDGSEISASGGLDFGAGVTIQGAGAIVAKGGFTNRGLIDGDEAGAELVLGGSSFGSALFNDTLSEATNGGGLLITGPWFNPLFPVFNQTMQATGAGSHLDLDNVEVLGGLLTTSDGGVIRILYGGASLVGGGGLNQSATPIGNSGAIDVRPGATLSLEGNFDNSGTITIGTKGGAASLRLTSEIDYPGGTNEPPFTVALTGSGSIVMTDNAQNDLFASHGYDILDNVDNTISGAGQIGGGAAMGLLNSGVIEATGLNALVVNVPGGRLENTAAGVMEAKEGSVLLLEGGLIDNLGLIQADRRSIVALEGSASLFNKGVVAADAAQIELLGAVGGVGTLELEGLRAQIEVGGKVAAGQTVVFGAGAHDTLKVDDPSRFASTISNWALSDTIDLVETDATSASISGDTLQIGLSGGGSLDYALSGPPSGEQVVLASDGSGGTDLTLFKVLSRSALKLSERMAAMPAASPGALMSHATGGPTGLVPLVTRPAG